MKNNGIVKFIGLILLLAVIIYLARESGLTEFLDVENAKDKISRFGILAPIVFIIIFTLATISFLPVTPLDLVAGALFETFWGVVYVVIGGTIGAMIAFWFTRTFGRSFVQKNLVDRFPNLEKYNKKIEEKGLGIMFVLRLVPLFPFNGLNFAMGLTKIKTRDYFLATFFGIIPGAFAYVYFGDALASADFSSLTSAVIVLIMLSLIYPIYNKTRKKDENEFDIIVIGAGAGGLNIASFMNKAGFKTMLIDRRKENIGGDCLNFGCIPSKAFIHVAKLVRAGKEAVAYGMKFGGEADMGKVKKHIKEVQEKIRKHESLEYFEKQGMRVVLGEANFVSRNEIRVGGNIYSAEKIVVATGSRPRQLEVKGVERVEVLNNENIFEIEKIPRKLLVVGGGPMGIEIGQAFSSLGSEVTIIHKGAEILSKERKEISFILREKLENDGIKVMCNTQIKKFTSDKKAIIHQKNQRNTTITFDAVFVAIGRSLDFSSLKLEKAEIEIKKDRILLDKYLRGSNKKVLFAGDVVGGPMFTHAAELHASVILKNFFSPFKTAISFDKFAWVTFSSPEIATFGLSEEDLKKRNLKYKVLERGFFEDDRALTDEYSDSKIFVYLDRKRRVLGGSIIAPNAGELMQEFLLAMNANLTIDKIFSKIYPYPTASRINKSVASTVFADKLNSNFNRKLLKLFYH